MAVVCIASLKRSEIFYANTFRSIPKSWRKKTYLFVHQSEVGDYDDAIPAKQIIPVPDDLKGLGRYRQYVADHAPDNPILLLDDDLRLCSRIKEKGRYRVVSAEENDKEECFDLLIDWLSPANVCQTAIGSEWRCHEKPSIVKNMMCGMAVGIDLDKMKEAKIRYDDFPFIMSDVYVCLSFLLKGYTNKVTFDYVIRRLPPNTEGGSSVYRTKGMMKEWSNRLAELFPGLVVVYNRKNNWPGLGTGTANARIAWKKAVYIGQNKKRA